MQYFASYRNGTLYLFRLYWRARLYIATK